MNTNTYKITLSILTLAGFLFSGYLSAVKFFTSVCFLGESCPYFLGYPACWYGFGLFTILFVSNLVGVIKTLYLRTVAKIHVCVSGLGILFASYFTIPEIIHIVQGTKSYTLGLPTCAYGFIFFVAIFVIAIRFVKRNNINHVIYEN